MTISVRWNVRNSLGNRIEDKDGFPQPVRTVRGHRDARVLRAGGSQSPVHPRLRGCLRAGLGLRISAGRLAVRAGRGGLDRRRAAALECQAAPERITLPLGDVLNGWWAGQRRPGRSPIISNEPIMWPDRRLTDLFKT